MHCGLLYSAFFYNLIYDEDELCYWASTIKSSLSWPESTVALRLFITALVKCLCEMLFGNFLNLLWHRVVSQYFGDTRIDIENMACILYLHEVVSKEWSRFCLWVGVSLRVLLPFLDPFLTKLAFFHVLLLEIVKYIAYSSFFIAAHFLPGYLLLRWRIVESVTPSGRAYLTLPLNPFIRPCRDDDEVECREVGWAE